MRRWSSLFVSFALLAACSGGAEPVPEPAPAPAPLKVEPVAPVPKPAGMPGSDVTVLPADANPALLDPSKAVEVAPEVYKVKFETTEGDFVIEVHKDQAPLGADRFYNLVKIGFFDDVAFFRVIDGFMVQFGISGYPDVASKWREANLKDDPVKGTNARGTVSFATAGPNTRTTQVFINFGENANLDGMGFAPFGKVVEGMEIVDKLYKGYGEGAPMGGGPDQRRLQTQGTSYLKKEFPELDYVKKASILP